MQEVNAGGRGFGIGSFRPRFDSPEVYLSFVKPDKKE